MGIISKIFGKKKEKKQIEATSPSPLDKALNGMKYSGYSSEYAEYCKENGLDPADSSSKKAFVLGAIIQK